MQARVTSASVPLAAQTPGVPRLIRFSGTLNEASGNVPTGNVTLKISFYAEQQSEQALWSEMQTVRTDRQGHYTALLGASEPEGLPNDLFSANQARWVGIEPMLPGVSESPRTLLVGVPYALKSVDSETLGGRPASDYVTLDALNGMVSQEKVQIVGAQVLQSELSPGTVIGSGVTDYLPIWTSSNTLADSTLFELNGNLGIGNTSPTSTLDVSGGTTVRGPLRLPALGTATPIAGFNSNPQDWFASAYSSSTHAAVSQDFRWQAEPVGNNSPSPSAKLDFLFGANGGNPAETGLSINSHGQITFAEGQTFPSGSVVQTLNNLTGALILAAGTNVSITPSGNTLTVASSALADVTHDGTLAGQGTPVAPLGIAVPLSLNANSAPATFSASNGEGDGVVGDAVIGDGVNGNSAAANKSGVYGSNSANGGFGVFGRNTFDGSTGYLGAVGVGVGGSSLNISGTATIGGNATVAGNVLITGELDVGGAKHFKIDDPIDPADKFLLHASVESNQMLTVYKGHVRTDAKGDAVVTLPEYFQALNTDVEYHLTAIGEFARAIVLHEVENNQFSIKTDKPNVKVSWEVLGVRNDAYARAHPMHVEEEKPIQERGKYLSPTEYGLSQEMAIDYERSRDSPSGLRRP